MLPTLEFKYKSALERLAKRIENIIKNTPIAIKLNIKKTLLLVFWMLEVLHTLKCAVFKHFDIILFLIIHLLFYYHFPFLLSSLEVISQCPPLSGPTRLRKFFCFNLSIYSLIVSSDKFNIFAISVLVIFVVAFSPNIEKISSQSVIWSRKF